MNEDDRFAALAEAEKEATTNSDEEESTESKSDAEAESDSEGGPAFPFDNDLRRSIYARNESWDEFEDALDFEVERTLRKERDIRDLAGREAHDAMVRLAAQHPDELVRLILEARGIENDE